MCAVKGTCVHRYRRVSKDSTMFTESREPRQIEEEAKRELTFAVEACHLWVSRANPLPQTYIPSLPTLYSVRRALPLARIVRVPAPRHL